MSEFMKIAAESPTHMREAANHMRKLAQVNIELDERAKLAETELTYYKLARRMEQRGLKSDLDFDEKLAYVRKIPGTKLAAFQEGIELANGGDGLGRVMNDEDKIAQNPGAHSASNDREFDEWIMRGGPHG